MRFQLLLDIVIDESNRYTLFEKCLGKILTLFVLAAKNCNIAWTDSMKFTGIFVLNADTTFKKLFDT